MEIKRAKGTKDFKPEEQIVRQEVIDLLRKIFEKYGYNPLETPVIERYETLSAKFAAGEASDALKETFTFEDQGGRKLGLRFDLTLPLSRFIAMNSNLKMPFKRYEIGRTYRDGPIKAGRLREFWQCDVDVIGTKSMIAEAELMAIVKEFFDKLELKFEIELNNRKILNGIFDDLEIKDKDEVMVSIDKLKKIGVEGVKEELKDKLDEDKITQLLFIFDVSGSNEEKIKALKKVVKSEEAKEGLEEIKEILGYSKLFGVNEVVFNPSLVRGLAYYTGPIFEVFLKNSKITSSFAGGGRYDKMIGNYLGGGDYPATGISFGLEPLNQEILSRKKTEQKTVVDVYVIPIKTIKESLKVLKELRSNDIKSDIDMNERSISKNLDYANKLGIPYVVFVGENELKEKKVKLRDMKSGNEELLSIEEIVKKIKS